MFLICHLFQAIQNLNFLSDKINFTPHKTFFEVINHDFLITGRLIETERSILENQNLRLSSMFNREIEILNRTFNRAGRLIETSE